MEMIVCELEIGLLLLPKSIVWILPMNASPWTHPNRQLEKIAAHRLWAGN
jgi:hypothetical protein